MFKCNATVFTVLLINAISILYFCILHNTRGYNMARVKYINTFHARWPQKHKFDVFGLLKLKWGNDCRVSSYKYIFYIFQAINIFQIEKGQTKDEKYNIRDKIVVY